MKKEEVVCSVCKQPFLKSLKKIKETIKNGKQHACSRKCASKISNEKRRYNVTTSNSAHTIRDKLKNPEKDLARRLVRKAIKQNLIIKPDNCEMCFMPFDKLEAHHEDHSRPYYIIWLCKECHATADRINMVGICTDHSDKII